MIEWKKEYEINVPEIDKQHQKLFEIAASAEQLLLIPTDLDKYDDIVKIINELRDYVVFHFNSEQQLLQKIKYPKILSHIVYHNDFVEKINTIDLDKVDNMQQKNLIEILNFIMQWIAEHVLGDDRQWAQYYHDNLIK